MIMRQWREILEGKKTQTRRIVKEHEVPIWADEKQTHITAIGCWNKNPDSDKFVNVKWHIDRTYAIVPKRGRCAIWLSPNGDPIENAIQWRYDNEYDDWLRNDTRIFLVKRGYREMRIRICSFRHERLQSISEADARAEGVESVEAYRDLWQSIYGKKKGKRWEDNPFVWVTSFEVVK